MGEAPTAFGWDEAQLAAVLPGAQMLSNAQLRVLALSCPGQAIELYDLEGNRIDPSERPQREPLSSSP